MTIKSSLQHVKRYCVSQKGCKTCKLGNKDGVSCNLAGLPPIRWDLSSIKEDNSVSVEDAISWLMLEFCITKEQATTLYHLLHITINSFKEG